MSVNGKSGSSVKPFQWLMRLEMRYMSVVDLSFRYVGGARRFYYGLCVVFFVQIQ